MRRTVKTAAGGPAGSSDEDLDRFIEISNLVFVRYLEALRRTRHLRPESKIDTGMGLQRFAAILASG